MDGIMDILADTIWDSLRLIPFLFLAYLAMEALEHKAGEKARRRIQGAGKLGPLWGAALGVIPHGFSAAASGLYMGRVITLGTLMSIYLSTSEEMLPVLLAEHAEIGVILKILGLKMLIGIISGYLVELVCRKMLRVQVHEMDIHAICETEHCGCESGILKSAVSHTVKICLYIFLVSLVLNVVIGLMGEERLGMLFVDIPLVGEMAAALVGLIPNCASSVVITELYLDGVIGTSQLMAGLLVNTGVGVLIILRQGHNRKEKLGIIVALYGIAVVWGLVIRAVGVVF